MKTKTKQGAHNVRFVVRRESIKENTFAVVSAVVKDEKLRKEKHFLEQLRKAITEWVKTTKDGKEAWEASSEDFNVGDLVDHTMCESFLDILQGKYGIRDLHIVTNSQDDAGNWHYDTVLVDEEDISA